MIDAQQFARVSNKVLAISPPVPTAGHAAVCLIESLGDPLLEAVNPNWDPQPSPTLTHVIDGNFAADLHEELEVIDRVCDVLMSDKVLLVKPFVGDYLSRLHGALKSCRLAGCTPKHLKSVWYHAIAARTELMDKVDSYRSWSALADAIWPHGSVSVPMRFVGVSPEAGEPHVVDLRKVRIARKLRSV